MFFKHFVMWYNNEGTVFSYLSGMCFNTLQRLWSVSLFSVLKLLYHNNHHQATEHLIEFLDTSHLWGWYYASLETWPKIFAIILSYHCLTIFAVVSKLFHFFIFKIFIWMFFFLFVAYWKMLIFLAYISLQCVQSHRINITRVHNHYWDRWGILEQNVMPRTAIGHVGQ